MAMSGRYISCLGCMEIVDTQDPKAFKDGLSRKEFTISGLCQDCQDATFIDDYEDEDIEWEEEDEDGQSRP
jgi:hypothetical protein